MLWACTLGLIYEAATSEALKEMLGVNSSLKHLSCAGGQLGDEGEKATQTKWLLQLEP